MTRPSPPGRTTLRVITGKAGEGDTTVVSSAAVDAAQARRDPEPGDVISGRYRLETLLGEGGMGRVFVATDLLYSQQYLERKAEVAIKFLGLQFAAHESARMALQREARKSQQLSHPNVVRVLHFDQDDQRPYMIMERMHGMPLDDYIRERAPTGLPFEAAWPLIEGMAAALAYIHGNHLVHSDFKPGNVFVTEDGTVKVLDLGIARAREDEQQKTAETRFDAQSLGALSPPFASCEMFEGLPSDPRDDIYGLGCVVYQLLTGHHPFNGTWAPQARAKGLTPPRVPGLNARRWRVLQRALSFDRNERLATADALLEGLRDDRFRRRRMIWGLAGTAGIGMAAAVALGLLFVQPPDPDQLFLNSLTPPAPVALSEPEQQRVARWLEQGTVYLQYAQDEFNAGSLDVAHHILRGGADNAYWAFDSVLQRVDSADAKSGILEIVNLYARWAQQIAAEDRLPDAIWTACQGLAIHPRHVRLNELAHEVSVQLARKLPQASTNCDHLATLAAPEWPNDDALRLPVN
jgi:serine/threonine protein kinase